VGLVVIGRRSRAAGAVTTALARGERDAQAFVQHRGHIPGGQLVAERRPCLLERVQEVVVDGHAQHVLGRGDVLDGRPGTAPATSAMPVSRRSPRLAAS
jgi:hypothetical protein